MPGGWMQGRGEVTALFLVSHFDHGYPSMMYMFRVCIDIDPFILHLDSTNDSTAAPLYTSAMLSGYLDSDFSKTLIAP